MTRYPLFSHRSLDTPLAWRHGKSIAVRQYLIDVRLLASALPPGLHMINACSDRYHFTVGLGAAMLAKKISLLPPTHTPEMMLQLKLLTPDVFCLFDAPHAIDLPGFAYRNAFNQARPLHDPSATPSIPDIPADQPVADVFTSGSTGRPQAHRKTWGSLVMSARSEAQRLGFGNDNSCNIIGTVPPQHMYGFESTLLMAMHSGGAIDAGQPFFPADIVSAIHLVPRPRILVTTPVHLRVLLESGVELPSVDLVLSATAPMALSLAHRCEVAFSAPLHEIYGATETGQIASRQTAKTSEWTLFPDINLTQKDARTWASGGHIAVEMPMNDLLESVDQHRFLLHGRLADRINIAGKSTSLAHLDHQLCSIDGVQDAAFFMPDEGQAEVVLRLMAFAVAPGMTQRALQTVLKTRIGSAFMPRPLVMLDALPRNSTGKLPREALKALAQAHFDRLNKTGGLCEG